MSKWMAVRPKVKIWAAQLSLLHMLGMLLKDLSERSSPTCAKHGSQLERRLNQIIRHEAAQRTAPSWHLPTEPGRQLRLLESKAAVWPPPTQHCLSPNRANSRVFSKLRRHPLPCAENSALREIDLQEPAFFVPSINADARCLRLTCLDCAARQFKALSKLAEPC